MKNPIKEWKTKQKADIIRQLELAYKIAEDLAKGATDAGAGLHALYNHLVAVIDCTRGKLQKRVKLVQEKCKMIWSENERDEKQAYTEIEYTLFGMLVGYKGTDAKVDHPHSLRMQLANVTEKMAEELLKKQGETKKQTDLAEKMVATLESFKGFADKSSADLEKRHQTEITKVKLEAEMQAGLAYDSGLADGKRVKPAVKPLPSNGIEKPS